MAKTDDTSTEKDPTAASKPVVKLTIKQFLGTVSMGERDKWVVAKIYAKNTALKTPAQWNKELNTNCKGITIKK